CGGDRKLAPPPLKNMCFSLKQPDNNGGTGQGGRKEPDRLRKSPNQPETAAGEVRPHPAPALGLRVEPDGLVIPSQTGFRKGNIMGLLSWLRNRTSLRSARRRVIAGTTVPRFRPRLEVLEGRDVPSTLTVTNNLDAPSAPVGSLRYEIAAAQSGDTIVFDNSLKGRTIALTGGELLVNKSLNIQ